jgi:signal transduction histidine kinase
MPEYRRDQSVVQSIVSTLKDETQQLLEEEDEKKLAEKYRLIFEQSVMGISFYSPEGRLLNANANMRQICHFDSEEGDAFFSNAILFDVPPFNEVIDRHHVEDFWACSHSVVPERDINDYLEIRLHPINDENGKLAYIGVATRNVSDERDIYLQAKQNDVKIREANIAIQRYEAELRYLMDNCNIRPWRASYERREIYFYQGLSVIERTMSFEEFEPYFIDDEGEIAEEFRNLEALYSKPTFILRRMRPIFGEPDEWLWMQLNTIPEYDENGKLKGTFGIMRNVTDIMKRQELLKHETERANDSGRLKSVFLANMTHEIRTPLNAIVGFSDLLQSMEGSEEKRELIHIIHNNCDMLLRLIDDILLLSNADNNAMELIPADTDAARGFDEICQTLSSRVMEAGLEFRMENPYEVCQTCLDSARIQQVIINFVTNAVKYTQQGYVRLGYRVERRDIDGQPHDGFYLYCEDTGSGIPKDQCERVFERFVKLNDYIQGTGLGLSICKIIVEKCGGQIGVESEVGQGSTFWFWIPAEIKELKEKSIIS